MFAVIRTGGLQYRVAADDVVTVGKVAGEPGEIIQFSEVLMLGGDTVTVGAPAVAGASVAAEVVEQTRGPKVIAFKKRRRKNSQAQARASAGPHRGADHRNPHRWPPAQQDGSAAGASGAAAAATEGDGRRPPAA